MKKIIALISILIILLLNGCRLIENTPYVKEISFSPEKISPGDNFKVFVTIKNPLSVEFKPYISLNYDKNDFQYQTYYYGENRISLEAIPSYGEKSYLLDFSVQRNAETGRKPIGIYLFGEESAKQSLSYKEEQIDVLSRVNK